MHDATMADTGSDLGERQGCSGQNTAAEPRPHPAAPTTPGQPGEVGVTAVVPIDHLSGPHEQVAAAIASGRPVGTAADIFSSCGFDVIIQRTESEPIYSAQLKAALQHFAEYRPQVHPVDGILLDAYLNDWLTHAGGWERAEAGRVVRSIVSFSPNTGSEKKQN